MEPPPADKLSVPTGRRIAVLLVLAAAWVFLMVWRLDSRTLHVDEYLTCYRTQPGAPLTDTMHPWTYYAYMRLWADTFGSSDSALRLASLPPAAVAVACVIVVAWWLLPWPGPVVALALVAFSGELLLYWRMARYFALVAGAFALVLLAAVGYLRSRRTAWVVLLAAASALCAYADYLPALTVLLPWAWLLATELRAGSHSRVALLLAAGILATLLALPAVSWAVQGAGQVTHPFHLDSPSAALLKGGLAVWSLLVSEVVPPWQLRVSVLALLGSTVLVVVGARAAWREGGPWRLVLLAWPTAIAIAWIALDFVPREPPVRIASFAVHALPWALLVPALGWYRTRTAWWAHAALAAVLLGSLTGLVNYFTLRNHLNPQYALDWRTVARFLDEHARSEDAVVTLFDAGFYRYYDHPGLTEEAVSLGRGGYQRLVRVIKSGHRVWMVTRERGSTDARKLARSVGRCLLDAGAEVEMHQFAPYSSQERAWRKELSPTETSGSYVTVFEFRLPDRETSEKAGPP